MPVSFNSRPIVSGCNFNAAGNPIVYKLVRVDYFIDQVNNSAGLCQFQFNGVNLTSYFQVGNTVASYPSSYSTYNRGVVTVSSFSGGNTLVTTDILFGVASGDDVLNNLSKRTDWKVLIEPFRAIGDTSLTNGVQLSFTTNITGLVYVDVSSIIKSFISAEWVDHVGISEVDALASVKFYIKIQEYYDGANQGAITNDSANPLHAVFSALQVGSSNGGNMLSFYPNDSGRNWLTKFRLNSVTQRMVMWRDWPFAVSYIHPDGIGSIVRRSFQYDAAGVLLTSAKDAISASVDDSVNRLKLPSINSATKTLTLELSSEPAQPAGYTDSVSIPDSSFALGMSPSGPWVNTGAGAGWGGDGVGTILVFGNSAFATQNLSINLRNRFLKIDITAHVFAGGTQNIQIYISGNLVASTPNVVGGGGMQTYTFYVYLSGGFENSSLQIKTNTPGSPAFVEVDNITIVEGLSTKKLADLNIEVRDVCDYDAGNPIVGQNPIHLFWKNSVGGDSFWNFSKYHEYTYTYQNGRKAKRIILFENELHPVQWEALQELNTTGEVYQTNIVELTSSINKTSQRVGQQVYILSQDGATKTGVIVIPATDRIFARDISDKASIEIELPEVFQL